MLSSEKNAEQSLHLMKDCSALETASYRENDTPLMKRSESRKLALFLTLLLMLSVTLNLYAYSSRMLSIQKPSRSKFASLELNRETIFESPGGEFRADWEPTSPDPGAVALHDDEVRAFGLPVAQRFPWDDEKGMYFISAFHSLHCIKALHQSIREYDAGVPPTHHVGHALHCLQSLEDDIKCFADDTPRYSTWDYPGHTGTNQKRMCRDWSKLEKWAKERTACYRYVGPGQDIEALLRYRYCPEGSPYTEKVVEIFGTDWEVNDNLTVEYPPIEGSSLADISY